MQLHYAPNSDQFFKMKIWKLLLLYEKGNKQTTFTLQNCSLGHPASPEKGVRKIEPTEADFRV